MFCSVEIAMLWLCSAASWSRVNDVVLNSGTSFDDTTSKPEPRARRHSSTAAEDTTDARATPQMTPTPKDPDSFAGWSDADVLQVLCDTHHFHKWHQWSFWPGDRWRHVFGSRLHFNALSAIRIRRHSCCNVRAFPKCSSDWLPRTRWKT